MNSASYTVSAEAAMHSLMHRSHSQNWPLEKFLLIGHWIFPDIPEENLAQLWSGELGWVPNGDNTISLVSEGGRRE